MLRTTSRNCRVAYGIIAHNKPELLGELVSALRFTDPDALVVVFNSSPRKDTFSGVDATIAASSRPLNWGLLQFGHFGIMESLKQMDAEYTHLSFLDSDMLPIRNDYQAFIENNVIADYMGVDFQRVSKTSKWVVGRRWAYEWPLWRQHFGNCLPHGAFNPGQTLTRELVEELLKYSRLPDILEQSRKSRLLSLEELLIPTLAVAVGATTQVHPNSEAFHGLHSPAELASLACDPTAALVHKFVMTAQSPDRVAARRLLENKKDVSDLQRHWDDQARDLPTQTKARARIRLFLRPLKELWIRICIPFRLARANRLAARHSVT